MFVSLSANHRLDLILDQELHFIISNINLMILNNQNYGITLQPQPEYARKISFQIRQFYRKFLIRIVDLSCS
jgi:hypothetical protein